VSDEAIKQSSPVRITAFMVLVHAIVCAPLLYELRAKVPAYEAVFRQYNMKMPYAAQWSLTASHGVTDGARVNLVLLGGLVAADAGLLWFLNRESRALAWTWFVLVILIVLLLALAVEGALALAQQKLREALSR
jgi:hypothetical protein